MQKVFQDLIGLMYNVATYQLTTLGGGCRGRSPGFWSKLLFSCGVLDKTANFFFGFFLLKTRIAMA